MKSLVRERLYYEIAMAIGNSLDLKAMLKEGLSTYLRKLNCLAGAVLRRVEDDAGLTSFELVYAIPRRMRPDSAVNRAIEYIPSGLDETALQHFMDGLPGIGGVDGHKHYLMDLPGFGLLLLVKSAPGLSYPDLKSLTPLNLKMAGACLSCIANERLQEEMRERAKAEAEYKAIFDNAVEGVFQADLNGRFLVANPAMAKLFGYDNPEDLIDTVKDIATEIYVHPEERERYINRLLRKGRVSGFEVEYYRRDGSIGWCSTSARLIRDEEGNPLHIEGMTEDITPRKQAVIALKEAKQEAVRLSQMKSNFLSMVSHELRTPLTAILGFAKITRKRLAEIVGQDSGCSDKTSGRLKRVADNTNVIIAEGERLTELINNVLDLAKLEAGYFEWHMEEVGMNEVLAHSLAATEVLFEGAKVALVQHVPEDLPMVMGDHDRLVQVTLNLISNGAKFTDRGTVTVSAAREGDEVVVRVADTGEGVPDDQREAVFDKFRQLGNTLTDRPKGTGLGLPICKEIVEHHKGRLWLESSSPEGSVFAYALPVS